MSRTEFFCFVEGVDNDRYFYSQFTSSIFKKNNLEVEYPTANSLSSSGKCGGKDPLLKFYNYLHEAGFLSSNFKGKKTTFVFLLDKDVDDLRSKIEKSKYVFYTEHYDLQNYLFIHGDVINSAAAGASIPVDDLFHTLGEQATWLSTCVMAWKEWVTVCLFLKIYEIPLGGYAEASRINFNKYGIVDQPLIDQYKVLALNKSNMNKVTFDMRYTEVKKMVDDFYATGQANRVFKGKWYLHWLENHLSTKHAVKISYKNLACILASNLDWNGRWTKPYKAKMSRVIKAHMQ